VCRARRGADSINFRFPFGLSAPYTGRKTPQIVSGSSLTDGQTDARRRGFARPKRFLKTLARA